MSDSALISLLKLPARLLALLARRPPPVRGRSARELAISAMEAKATLRLRYEGHVGYLDVEPHALFREGAGRLMLLCHASIPAEAATTPGGWYRLAVADIVAAFPGGGHFIPRTWPEALAPEPLLHRIPQPEPGGRG